MSSSASAEVYKLKTVEFIGRKVSIVLQNKNGPCPLLAIANVLLLRNQVYLPLEAADVSQDRLIALVANHLLEANSEEALRGRVDEEYRVNLHRNIEDAIALLPKLTTGVDVNPRFSSITAFEFTDETAIFDLLDISLVHGWLVDAQDPQAREAVGEMSYNELVTKLATLLGAATPKHLTSRPPSARALRTPPAASQAKGLGRFDMRTPVSPHMGAEAACPTPTATPAASMELPSPLASLKPPVGPSRLGTTGSGTNQATLVTLHSAAEAIAEDAPAESAGPDNRVDEAGLDLDAEDSATLQEALALSIGSQGAALPVDPSGPTTNQEFPGAATSALHASDSSQHAEQHAEADPLAPYSVAGSLLQQSPAGLEPLPATESSHPAGAASSSAAASSSMAAGGVGEPASSQSTFHGQPGHVQATTSSPGAVPDHSAMSVLPADVPAGTSDYHQLQQQQQQQDKEQSGAILTGQGNDNSRHHAGLSSEPMPTLLATPSAASLGGTSPMHEAGSPIEAQPPLISEAPRSELQAAAESTAAGPEPESQGPSEDTGLSAAGAAPGVGAAKVDDELTSRQPLPAQSPGIAEVQASEQELPPGSPIAAPATPSAQATPAQPSRTPEQKAKDAAEARLLQDFLESTSNQLTYSGLEGLLKGLRPNELAVFFRNNHFNTVFLHKGSLHILVTDMGYLAHPDVVWERLDSVQGDTEYLTGSFASHRDKAFAEEVSRAAKLTQAAFSDVIPPASESGTSHDQDFALALQLQEEERDRDRRRLQQQQAQQQQAQQQQRSAARPADKPTAAQARQQQQGSASRGVVPSARAQQQQRQQQQASASQQGQRQSRSKGKGMCILM